MDSKRQQRQTVRVIDNDQDHPNLTVGALLPAHYHGRQANAKKPRLSPAERERRQHRSYQLRITAVSMACILIIFSGGFVAATRVVNESTAVAAPVVSLMMPDARPGIVELGANQLFSKPAFFAETKDQFMAEGLTFIEANLSTMELSYIKDGEVALEVPILSKGREDSWWETPAGLYEVATKKRNHMSSFGGVNLPYSMPFQGNFFIHGWPEYADGTPVPEGYSGGCIRLATEDAGKLYELVAAGTPVLVFEESFAGDDFVYEASLPDMAAAEYLLADIDNNTVLAASDMDSRHPIASITKLMTALVAAEYINLDKRVRPTQERYVQTLIPRIQGSATASMYSLLQLLLVESSNEAAEVIASQLGRERFIELMNTKAAAIGLTNTTFTDPSGLDNGNVSTVGDLFTLLQYLKHNRHFILSLTVNQDLPTAYESGDFGTLTNFNSARDIPSFVGGKVGQTLAAGNTNASLHELEIDGEVRTIAVVVLGSDNRTRDTNLLLEYARDRYGAEEVLRTEVGR